jgi:putative integral membrane protein (TIGR02587 family)
VALGILFSVAVLVLVGEVRFAAAAVETLGKVVIAAFPVSLGVSFANAHLRNKSRTGEENRGRDARGGRRTADRKGPKLPPLSRQLRQDLKDLGVTVSGALVFSFNLAPTEEVVMIATRIPAWHHLLIMAASLLLCHTIIFAAGFREHEVHVPSPFQHPWVETLMAYAVSLLVAMGLLYLVGVPEATSGAALAAKCAVTLGLPAVVGASAGRLIL